MGRTIAAVAVALALGCPQPARADYLLLTNEGVRIQEELKRMLHPAPLVQTSFGPPGFRAIVLEAIRAEDAGAPYDSIEGRPKYRVVAFGARGADKSEVVVLSELWVRPSAAIDAMTDLRTLGSTRDHVLGVPLGGPIYMAALRASLDPDGSLGLKSLRGNVQLAETPQARPGALERLLPAGRQAFAMEPPTQLNRLVGERKPIMDDAFIWRTMVPAYVWCTEIARARKYPQVYEKEFAGAALALAEIFSDVMYARSDGAGAQRGRAMRQHGMDFWMTIPAVLGAAHPGWPSAAESVELQRLVREIQRLPEEADAAELEAKRRRIRELATAAPTRGWSDASRMDKELIVSPSEVADVALDLLLQGDGPYALPDKSGFHEHQVLVHSLVRFGFEPHWYDLRREDGLPLREKAMRALVRLIQPEPSRFPAVRGAQERAAPTFLGALYDEFNLHADPGLPELAFASLDAAGWPDPKQGAEKAASQLNFAVGLRRDAESSTLGAERFQRRLGLMRRFAALADSPNENARVVGVAVRNQLARMREASRAGYASRDSAWFLEQWDRARGS